MARYIIKDGKKYAPPMRKVDKSNPDGWNDATLRDYASGKYKPVNKDEETSMRNAYSKNRSRLGGNGQVRSYKRRTKSGKVVTVKAHTRNKKTTRPIGSGTNGPVRKK